MIPDMDHTNDANAPHLRNAMDVLTFMRTGKEHHIFTVRIRRAGLTVELREHGIPCKCDIKE
jgi:hypothetical protein